MTRRNTRIPSPVGTIAITADGDSIAEIRFTNGPPAPSSDSLLNDAVRQLEEYFARDRRDFNLPLRPVGTPFQSRVWSELTRIPYGETISYGELAARIGDPKASRAVGAANGRNPIPIVIPCHRVIGANGSLTGYGGGMAIKRLLLELERPI